jgi:hypothetical protein
MEATKTIENDFLRAGKGSHSNKRELCWEHHDPTLLNGGRINFPELRGSLPIHGLVIVIPQDLR